MSDNPFKVADNLFGLKVIVKPLAWVCEISGEQVKKSPEKGTNEANYRFLTCAGSEAAG